jgi:hypothetical protein
MPQLFRLSIAVGNESTVVGAARGGNKFAEAVISLLAGVLQFLNTVSRLERFVLAVRMSLVMNGLWGWDGQEIFLVEACLSRREERVEANCLEKDWSVLGGALYAWRYDAWRRNIIWKINNVDGFDISDQFSDTWRSRMWKMGYNIKVCKHSTMIR